MKAFFDHNFITQYAIYLLFLLGGLLIVWLLNISFSIAVPIFLFGYLAGRITKAMDR